MCHGHTSVVGISSRAQNSSERSSLLNYLDFVPLSITCPAWHRILATNIVDTFNQGKASQQTNRINFKMTPRLCPFSPLFSPLVCCVVFVSQGQPQSLVQRSHVDKLGQDQAEQYYLQFRTSQRLISARRYFSVQLRTQTPPTSSSNTTQHILQ